MTRVIGIVVVLLAVVYAPGVGEADPINFATANAERPNLVSASTGLDHGFVGELGYLRVSEALGRRAFVGGELEVPWARFDLGDLEVRPTVGIVALGGVARGWQLAGFVRPTMRRASNALASMTSLGADVRATGGWYARRGFIAAEVGVDWSVMTYIHNSDAYRMMVYSDAKDGWYRNTGATVYADVTAGLSFGNQDLSVRFGMPREPNLDAQVVPWFVLLGVSFALPR